MGVDTVLVQLPLNGSEINSHFPQGREEWKWEVKQEKTRKIFISSKSPLVHVSLDCIHEMIPGCQETPGIAVTILQAPAGLISTVIPTNSHADVDNAILVAPNYSEN